MKSKSEMKRIAMMKKKPKVEVEYEGMGTCIEAYLKVNGRKVITIASDEIDHNDVTSIIVRKAVEILEAIS